MDLIARLSDAVVQSSESILQANNVMQSVPATRRPASVQRLKNTRSIEAGEGRKCTYRKCLKQNHNS
jgi:hypothetical protein